MILLPCWSYIQNGQIYRARFIAEQNVCDKIHLWKDIIGSELIPNNAVYNRKSNGSAVCSVFPVNWASQVAQKESGKESACQCRRHRFDRALKKIPWSRKWQPTPVFLPGKLHGQWSLADYSLKGHKELNTTEPAWMNTNISWVFYISNLLLYICNLLTLTITL